MATLTKIQGAALCIYPVLIAAIVAALYFYLGDAMSILEHLRPF